MGVSQSRKGGSVTRAGPVKRICVRETNVGKEQKQSPLDCGQTSTLASPSNLEVEEEEMTMECSHWWVLPSPDGPTCIGVCKLCGERREFPNSLVARGYRQKNGHYRQADITISPEWERRRAEQKKERG